MSTTHPAPTAQTDEDPFAPDEDDEFWASTWPAEDEDVFADYTDEELVEIVRKAEARHWEVVRQERARGISG